MEKLVKIPAAAVDIIFHSSFSLFFLLKLLLLCYWFSKYQGLFPTNAFFNCFHWPTSKDASVVVVELITVVLPSMPVPWLVIVIVCIVFIVFSIFFSSIGISQPISRPISRPNFGFASNTHSILIRLLTPFAGVFYYVVNSSPGIRIHRVLFFKVKVPLLW